MQGRSGYRSGSSANRNVTSVYKHVQTVRSQATQHSVVSQFNPKLSFIIYSRIVTCVSTPPSQVHGTSCCIDPPFRYTVSFFEASQSHTFSAISFTTQ
jgi:hypothetical protein